MRKKVAQYIFRRGATHYVRVCIPAQLRSAYPPEQTHALENLQTADEREAKARGQAALARIYADFGVKRQQLDLARASLAPKRVERLTHDELALLGHQLASQHADLSRQLAQGKSQPILGALQCHPAPG